MFDTSANPALLRAMQEPACARCAAYPASTRFFGRTAFTKWQKYLELKKQAEAEERKRILGDERLENLTLRGPGMLVGIRTRKIWTRYGSNHHR